MTVTECEIEPQGRGVMVMAMEMVKETDPMVRSQTSPLKMMTIMRMPMTPMPMTMAVLGPTRTGTGPRGPIRIGIV